MKYTFLLLLTALLSSCHFYFSEVPIRTSEKSVVNPKILGKWYLAEKEDENAVIARSAESIEVFNFNNREYAVIISGEDGTGLFRMHETILNSKTFLNIFPIENTAESAPKYFFFILDSFNDETAQLRYLTDSVKVHFSKSKDLEKYLKKNFDKLEKECLSAPVYYYRDQFFLWDKINTQKSADIVSFSIIDAPYAQTSDKTATQLSIFPKTETDVKTAAYFISNAYYFGNKNDEFSAASTRIIKFKDGSLKVLDYSQDAKDFFDRESRKYYKIKEGPGYPKK